MKKRWCERLIADGKIAPYGVVRHCFTDGGGRADPGVSDDIMPTIDTRPDCFGVAVPSAEPKVMRVGNRFPSDHRGGTDSERSGNITDGHGEPWAGDRDIDGGGKR